MTAASPRSYPEPRRRQLKIYAMDPLQGNAPGNKIAIDIPFEPLRPGPCGRVFQVIDYDATNDRYYEPVELDRTETFLNQGMDHSEADPRFHQQMVYAVASRVLENFEKALGRKVRFGGVSPGSLAPLRIFPHAFQDANAYFDPDMKAVLFGYFAADEENVGRNLPGQAVFTCLSHDVIAHELTHAILHRQRKYFIEPTNVDAAAFHEGFADIVALFQRFTYRDNLRAQLNQFRGAFEKGGFFGLAAQFGTALGDARALREALPVDGSPPPVLKPSVTECHDRGAILLGAVFDAFTGVFNARVKDLYRIATGGSGVLPDGELSPDLVERMTEEAAKAADSLLRMCVRAIDYLPPVDVTLGDYLRAIATADVHLVQQDKHGQLDMLVEAFRKRQIYPQGVTSLSAESLLWPPAAIKERLPDSVQHAFWQVGAFQAMADSADVLNERERYSSLQNLREVTGDYSGEALRSARAKQQRAIAYDIWQFAQRHAAELGLSDPDKIKVAVHGFHQTIRVSPDGRWLPQTIIQLVQSTDDENLGGLKLRGGTTLIADAEGVIRHIVAAPLPTAMKRSFAQQGKERLKRMYDYVDYCDAADARMAWADDHYRKVRMERRARFRALHDGFSY